MFNYFFGATGSGETAPEKLKSLNFLSRPLLVFLTKAIKPFKMQPQTASGPFDKPLLPNRFNLQNNTQHIFKL